MLDFQSDDTDHGFFLLAEHGAGQAATNGGEQRPALAMQWLAGLDAIVVTKPAAGFVVAQVTALRRLVRDIAAGAAGPCKFLIFDLDSSALAVPPAPPGFDALLDEMSNLICEAPVISVAWARNALAGPDIELALACSMMVGEAGTRFSFEVDLDSSLRSYALLAHKLGFVRAERLLENGTVLEAAAVHEMMLLHSVVPAGGGLEAVRSFVAARSRRHNSACGIYRAQRVAMLGKL